MSCRIRFVVLAECWLAGVCSLAGCGRTERGAVGNASTSTLSADELVIGLPIVQGNLTVFPVSSKSLRDDDHFITLDQGLKAGTVEIREMGSPNSPAANSSTENAQQDNPLTAQIPQQSMSQATPQAVQSAMEHAPAQSPLSSDPVQSASTPAIVPTGNDAAQQPSTSGQASNYDYNPFGDARASDAKVANGAAANENDISNNTDSGSPEVNRLMVVNNSDQSLYLMPGEIIVGGEQDRVVGQEYIIAAHSGPTPINVFCVEQGRWQPKEAGALGGFIAQTVTASTFAETVAVSPQATDASKAAQESANGKFVAAVGNLSKEGRLAVQADKNQLQVWDKVSKVNAKADVQSDTDAFTGIYIQEDAIKRLEPYLEKLKAPVSNARNIVGVVVAINGKVESMDVFQSTPLFQRLWPKLLKSYALDAANASPDNQNPPLYSVDDAQQFLSHALTAQSAETKADQNILVTTRQTDQIVSFAAAEGSSSPSNAGGLGGGGGGFGGAVHVSGFAK